MADDARKADDAGENTDGFYTVHADMALNDIVSNQESSADLARRMDAQLDQLVDVARSRRRTLLTTGQRRSFGLDDEYAPDVAEGFLARIAELVAGGAASLTQTEREELHSLRAKAQQQALTDSSLLSQGHQVAHESVSGQDEHAHQTRWSKYSTKGSALRVNKVVELYNQLTVLEKRAFCDALDLSPKEVVDELEHMLTEAADALASIEDEAFVKQANDEFAGLEGDDLIAALMQKNQELSAQVEQFDVAETMGQDDKDSHHQSSTPPVNHVPQPSQPETTTTLPTAPPTEDIGAGGDDSTADGGRLHESDVPDDGNGQLDAGDSSRAGGRQTTRTVIVEGVPAGRQEHARGSAFQASPARVGKDDLAFAQTHLDAPEDEAEEGEKGNAGGDSADGSYPSLAGADELMAEDQAGVVASDTSDEFDVDVDDDDKDNTFDNDVVEDVDAVDNTELLEEFPDDDAEDDSSSDDDAEGFADLDKQEASEYFDEGGNDDDDDE